MALSPMRTKPRAGSNAEATRLFSRWILTAPRTVEDGSPPAANAIDEYFEKEWVRSVFSLALETFRAQMIAAGKETHLRLFERYVLDADDEAPKKSYKALAAEFNLSTSDVTNYLRLARREFRRIVLEKLRELTATDEEFRREARALLGVDPR